MQTEQTEEIFEECYDQYGHKHYRPANMMPVPEQVGDVIELCGQRAEVARVVVQHADNFPPNMRIQPCGDYYAPQQFRMSPILPHAYRSW